MIRYLHSKVNLWEGKYFFSMMEDKMIYQVECFENMAKMGTVPFFWTGILYEDSLLYLYRKSSLSPFLLRK